MRLTIIITTIAAAAAEAAAPNEDVTTTRRRRRPVMARRPPTMMMMMPAAATAIVVVVPVVVIQRDVEALPVRVGGGKENPCEPEMSFGTLILSLRPDMPRDFDRLRFSALIPLGGAAAETMTMTIMTMQTAFLWFWTIVICCPWIPLSDEWGNGSRGVRSDRTGDGARSFRVLSSRRTVVEVVIQEKEEEEDQIIIKRSCGTKCSNGRDISRMP